MKGVIYARYSSHNQSERSIEGQIEDCTKYADDHGIDIIKHYIDRAMTGTNDNRADFQQMLSDAKRKAFDCVIVWKIDRFGRNREEIAINKRKLKKSGVMLLYAKENIPDGPEGVILESVLEGLAEYYSKDLSQKVKRGMHTKALTCRYNGGNVPFGYSIVDGEYIPNDNAPAVKEIFDKYNNGYTFAEIARWLNDAGYRTHKGSEFRGYTVRQILKNKKYIGTFTFDDVEIEDGIPSIISKGEFMKAQDQLSRSTKGRKPTHDNQKYTLIGKLNCGYCGKPMIADGGKNPQGIYYSYYTCKGRKEKTCNAKAIRKELIETMVYDKTMAFLNDKKLFKQIESTIKDAFKNTDESKHIKVLQKEKSSVENATKRLLKAIETGTIPEQAHEETANRINELMERKREIETALYKIRADATVPDDFTNWYLSKLKGDSMENIIYTFVHQVVLYESKILIIYSFSDKKTGHLFKEEMPFCSSNDSMVARTRIELVLQP